MNCYNELSPVSASCGGEEAGGRGAAGSELPSQELPHETCHAHSQPGTHRGLQGQTRGRHRLSRKCPDFIVLCMKLKYRFMSRVILGNLKFLHSF